MTKPPDVSETTRLPAATPTNGGSPPDRDAAAGERRPAPARTTPEPTGTGLNSRQGKQLALMAMLLVLIGSGVGFMVSLFSETQYAARAQLIYDVRELEPTGFLREDRNLTTQQLLLSSRALLEPVATPNGLTVEELDEKLDATIVEGSEIINMELRDPSRETGTALLTAVNDQYLQFVNSGGGQEDTRAYLEAQLAAVSEQITAAGESSEVSSLSARRTDLSSQLDALNLAGPQAQILVPPYSVEDAVSPQPLLAAAAGGLAGVLIAAIVIGLVARRWSQDTSRG